MTNNAATRPLDRQSGPASQPAGRVYRYPRRALTGAYLRSAAGLTMVGIPLIWGDPGKIAAVVLGCIAAAFCAYGARTWLRGMSRILLDNDGISIAGPVPVSVMWDEMTGAKLSYYSTRRDGTGGWMQLTISGTRGKLTTESSLDGFVDIARRVVAETRARRIELSASTRNNLGPLGIPSASNG